MRRMMPRPRRDRDVKNVSRVETETFETETTTLGLVIVKLHYITTGVSLFGQPCICLQL